MHQIKPALLAAIVILLMGLASSAWAAPKSKLWERWATHNSESQTNIDHSTWSTVLSRHVVPSSDGINRFAYDKLANSPLDKKLLRDYLQNMAQIEISQYNRDQQLAYWINLYNAITIAVVIEAFPVESIRDISDGLFSSGPWDRELMQVEGEMLSLNDIEHRILRPIWQDPRIHYAVNCASIGCPNLQAEAFTAENVEVKLHSAAIEFINHPRGASVVKGKLQVSSIYDWFEADFGGSEVGVIEHLRQYADADLKAALNQIDDIDNDSYDWNLNADYIPKVNDQNSKKQSGRSRGS